MRARRLLGSLVFGLLVLSSGCGSPAPSVGGKSLMTEAERRAEYQEAVAGYAWPLPPGRRFPPPSALPAPEEPTLYEVGEGANQVDTFWICSWMGAWLSTRLSDPAAARQAWSWVEKADRTDLHTKRYYDPRDVWHREILAPARTGRIEAFQEFYDTSCGWGR